MTTNRKLPLPLQLVLLTATLVFSLAAYRLFILGYGLWVSWDEIQASEAVMDWSSLYLPALRHSLFAGLSVAVFVSVVLERRYYPDISFAFLAALALLSVWGTYVWVSRNYHFWPYQERTGIIVTSAAIRLLVLAWLGALMINIFPRTLLGTAYRGRHA